MTQQKQILYTEWLESGTNIENSALERVASLSGLMALVGSEKSFLPVSSNMYCPVKDLDVPHFGRQFCRSSNYIDLIQNTKFISSKKN